ncbi:hypothetical protein NUU61_009892 [Penicillium alfredii]|uniref:Zn(2)-C6 fungal-type domain-containing protein n=1 Tax=Penicillium alfredii TaxID=1506179 RepID=A0A9W9JTX9_9EURO|nr:uncharacterized protein NUU61_009892 [Penicillium alfredii]KAJ5081628.1 hypothetical protein NUU61_009892 [Penicillium alfredii]
MPKISRNCANCRAIKRRCDQQLPHCGQCIRARQKCPGYRDEWELVFRDQTDRTIKRTEEKRVTKLNPACITTIRKAKCDETYPHYTGSTCTSRKCDGYLGLLSLKPTMMPDVNPIELRSLAFFQQVVAPVLSGPLGRSFWTQMVIQVVHQDSAARHATMAISVLYERLDQNPQDSVVPYDSGFMLRHYNQAIKSVLALKAPGPSDLDTVLLICVLFTCIEFLRGDVEAALQHCRHGTQILTFHTPQPELLAILRHMGIFPLFAANKHSDHPLSASQIPITTGPFQSLLQAQEALDRLTHHIVGLFRAKDHCRASDISSSAWPPTPLIKQQERVVRGLEVWQSAMTEFKSRNPIPQAHATIDRILQVRWLAGKIWSSACLTPGEGVYNAYMDEFEQIIELASYADPPAKDSSSPRLPKFTFEMGFVSAVYFVALKCRHLPLRLKALSMLATVGCPRETMWDRDVMKGIVTGIIEWEHDVKLTPEKIEEIMAMKESPPEPSKDRRIGDLGVEDADANELVNPEPATKMIFHLPAS